MVIIYSILWVIKTFDDFENLKISLKRDVYSFVFDDNISKMSIDFVIIFNARSIIAITEKIF